MEIDEIQNNSQFNQDYKLNTNLDNYSTDRPFRFYIIVSISDAHFND